MTGNQPARGKEHAAVYSAGLIRGVALVAFPVVRAIFTSADGYGR